MTKNNNKKMENLYDFSKNTSIKNQEKINKNKQKEREKRIKQKNLEKKDTFDLDTEIVIGMTNKNNQKIRQENQKKMTKKQAQILKKKKKIKKIIKLISLLVLITCGIIFALVSPLFNISDIQVINNSKISTETIISLSKLNEGQNIFKFNKKDTVQNIKTNAYIESATIKRKIPNKIEINIVEREKKYNVEFLNGYAYINNQGYILEISKEKDDMPVIQGISTKEEQIVEGNRLNTQDLSKLEIVIQIMNICKSYEIDSKVTKIDITNKNNYILYMEQDKKTIYLGDETNLSNKMLYVPAILQETEGKEGTIYVNGDINNNFKPRFKEKV